jgi:hypothetical protein
MLEIKGVTPKRGTLAAHLNAFGPLPYHFRAGRYQCFGHSEAKAAQDESPARWRAG